MRLEAVADYWKITPNRITSKVLAFPCQKSCLDLSGGSL